jgi:hypothetical protein
MATRVKQWLKNVSAQKPVRLVFYVFCIVTILVIILSLPFYLEDPWQFWGSVLIEIHGLLFELLIMGVFLLWLESLGEKQLTITRYREKIGDYLGWDDDEATYRIIANIKRLNRYGISNINLTGAFLKGANLTGINLRSANLLGADLRGANLKKADLSKANLTGAHLKGTDLRKADIRGTNFLRAELSGANLEGAVYNIMTKWPKGFDPAGAILYEKNKTGWIK